MKKGTATYTYDETARAYYLKLSDSKHAETREILTFVDIDENNKLIGIELVYDIDFEPPEEIVHKEHLVNDAMLQIEYVLKQGFDHVSATHISDILHSMLNKV